MCQEEVGGGWVEEWCVKGLRKGRGGMTKVERGKTKDVKYFGFSFFDYVRRILHYLIRSLSDKFT